MITVTNDQDDEDKQVIIDRISDIDLNKHLDLDNLRLYKDLYKELSNNKESI